MYTVSVRSVACRLLKDRAYLTSEALMTQPSASGNALSNERSTKILAKSFYRQLRENGYTHNQVVTMASELISLVTQDIRQTPGSTGGSSANA